MTKVQKKQTPSFLQRFQGKTNTISKYGLNELFINTGDPGRRTRDCKTVNANKTDTDSSRYLQFDQTVPSYPKLITNSGIKKSKDLTNSNMKQKSSQMSIYLPLGEHLPRIQLKTQKPSNSMVHSKDRINQIRLDFNLSKDAYEHLQQLDKLVSRINNRKQSNKIHTR